ncbi:MAG: DUF1579 domain-containing protein [Phycisphaerales bacterium]
MSSKQLIATFGAGAVCAGALAFVIGAGPDDAKKDHQNAAAQPAAQEMSPEAMEEMQQWMEVGTPGQPHEWLAKSVGDWDLKGWFKMDPAAPPTEFTGTMSTEPVFDGRYFASQMDCTMMGMPMQGRALMGYDNIQGKYVSTWIDSMSTAIFFSTGSMSADGTKLIMRGTMTEPDGTETVTKMVTSWDGDTYVDTFYNDVDGEWDLHGKITYTRKGTQAHAQD